MAGLGTNHLQIQKLVYTLGMYRKLILPDIRLIGLAGYRISDRLNMNAGIGGSEVEEGNCERKRKNGGRAENWKNCYPT